jgi:hypothetical protein
VHVTVDGDEDDFSLSRKVFRNEWNQTKQKCTGKSQDAFQINAKLAKTKGELTAIFDRLPVQEVVKARQLIKLYQGEDPDKETKTKKDLAYNEQIIAYIDQYLILKTI